MRHRDHSQKGSLSKTLNEGMNEESRASRPSPLLSFRANSCIDEQGSRVYPLDIRRVGEIWKGVFEGRSCFFYSSFFLLGKGRPGGRCTRRKVRWKRLKYTGGCL